MSFTWEECLFRLTCLVDRIKLAPFFCDVQSVGSVFAVQIVLALPFLCLSYLAGTKVAHSIRNLPGKLHQLLWRQIGLGFNIRVLKIRVIEATALPQVTQQITIRYVLDKDKYWVCKPQQHYSSLV